MYVEIGSLEEENFHRILDLITSRPMKKYLYVAVLGKIILFSAQFENYFVIKIHFKRSSQIFNQMKYRNYLKSENFQ